MKPIRIIKMIYVILLNIIMFMNPYRNVNIKGILIFVMPFNKVDQRPRYHICYI